MGDSCIDRAVKTLHRKDEEVRGLANGFIHLWLKVLLNWPMKMPNSLPIHICFSIFGLLMDRYYLCSMILIV